MPQELIGRSAERERLRELVAGAHRGSGGIVVLCGDAGIGKTRLTQALGSDALVLRGTAAQGRTAPYGPLVAVLRAHLHAHPGAFDDLGPLRGHLALLLPELGEPAEQVDRLALFEALRAALGEIAARHQAVVVLDDLQWSDEATLEVLSALAEPLRELPLLVVATHRTDGLPRDHGVRRLRNELRRAGHLQVICLKPLDLAETAALLEQALDEPPSAGLVRAIHDRTEGIPFFVEELAAALRVSGALRCTRRGAELADDGEVPLPDTVRDAVLISASELSPAGRRAAEVAAVAGETFDLGLVAGLASEDGLTDLIESGMAGEAGDGTGAFRHALAREALYLDIPWAGRRRLHGQIAEALEASGAGSREVAPHWLGARAGERARGALLRAAVESEAVHAYRDAAEAGRQALELWPDDLADGRAEALERYARCCQLAS